MSTDNRAGPTLLNGSRVRGRRHELGLSERKAAAMMGSGFSVTVLRSLEAGTNHDDLTLGVVRRLANLLDLPIDQLLTPVDEQVADDTAQPVPVGPAPLHDYIDRAVRRVGAVLVAIEKAMPEQVLADLGEVLLDELPVVLDELDRRLALSGARLHRVLGLVGVRPVSDGTADVDDETIREAWRRHLGRVSLNIGQVNVFAKAVRGELTKPAGNDQAVKTAELVNAGLLQRTTTGGYEPSPAAAYSLLFDPS